MIFFPPVKEIQRRPDRVNVVIIAAAFQAYRDPACSNAKTRSIEAAKLKKDPVKSSLFAGTFERTGSVWWSGLVA